jgi:hypothetical protein
LKLAREGKTGTITRNRIEDQHHFLKFFVHKSKAILSYLLKSLRRRRLALVLIVSQKIAGLGLISICAVAFLDFGCQKRPPSVRTGTARRYLPVRRIRPLRQNSSVPGTQCSRDMNQSLPSSHLDRPSQKKQQMYLSTNANQPQQ